MTYGYHDRFVDDDDQEHRGEAMIHISLSVNDLYDLFRGRVVEKHARNIALQDIGWDQMQLALDRAKRDHAERLFDTGEEPRGGKTKTWS